MKNKKIYKRHANIRNKKICKRYANIRNKKYIQKVHQEWDSKKYGSREMNFLNFIF